MGHARQYLAAGYDHILRRLVVGKIVFLEDGDPLGQAFTGLACSPNIFHHSSVDE